MEFNGIIRVRGCSFAKAKFNYPVLFEIGSKAFIKSKALRGIIEFIAIKKSFFKEKTYSSRPLTIEFKEYEVAYLDTFNRFWMEGELITQSEALYLAELFWKRIDYELEYIGNKTCTPN